ncbi:MAG: putative cupredoxin-like copper-binding protein [Paraglaciecola sp.]
MASDKKVYGKTSIKKENIMKTKKILKLLTISLALMVSPLAYADGDLSRADIKTVVLEMGTNDDGRMYFTPSHLKLKTGQAYKIVLKNVDKVKHEVEANEFADKIFTRKVEIKDSKGGLVAEIKGNVREVEIGPNTQVEWFVVPVQTGTEMEMVCALPGHKEAGMHGLITVE